MLILGAKLALRKDPSMTFLKKSLDGWLNISRLT